MRLLRPLQLDRTTRSTEADVRTTNPRRVWDKIIDDSGIGWRLRRTSFSFTVLLAGSVVDVSSHALEWGEGMAALTNQQLSRSHPVADRHDRLPPADDHR
jgi:hypothetical protein